MSTTTIERRMLEQAPEFRAASEGEAGLGVLTGYAAVWDSESRDLGGFTEVISRGAFGEPLDDAGALDLAVHVRVIARTNHNSDLLLGTTDAGTLRLFLDDVGLRYEIDLPNTTAGRDVAVLAGRGDIRFSSFAFRVLPDGARWSEGADGRLIRTVTAASLSDVAPVADPAYWGSSSEMQREFDLDAVRASLSPPDPPPGEWESAATARASAITEEIERGL